MMADVRHTQTSDSSGKLSDAQLRTLWIVNGIAVALMVLHDLDHLRVILTRGYRVDVLQLVPVVLAYLPTLLALVLVKERSPLAALGSVASGAFVAAGVMLIHALGMSVISRAFNPFFLEWGQSYCTIGVDYLTWGSFWSLLVWALITLTVGLRILLGQLQAADRQVVSTA